MGDRAYRPTLEALEDRVTPADFSGLNFGGLDFSGLTSGLPDFSNFSLSDIQLPNLTDLGNGLGTLQLAANGLANSGLVAGFSGLLPGPSSGLFQLNDSALSAFQLESEGLTAGSTLFGNLGTLVSGADTLNNFIQGDFAGTAISGVGTAASGLGSLASLFGASAETTAALGPLGGAISLGIGLGANVGAPLLTSTDFGNNLVNNLSDALLQIPGVNDALLNLSNNFDSFRGSVGDFISNPFSAPSADLGTFSDFSLPTLDLGDLGSSFGSSPSFDFGNTFDFGSSFDFGGGDASLFDPQFAAGDF
jgi:hypothetical protein